MTKHNTPALRFDGFGGEWETSKIANLFAERVESFPEGELLSVTTHRGIKRFEEIGRHDTSNADKSKYKLVEIGDIAYNSMRMWQGASGVSPYRGIVSPAYTVLRPIAELDSGFFSFLFKVSSLVSVFKERSQGLTSDTWNLKFPAFSEIEVTHPTAEEQRAIGELFSDLDALIEQHRAKHANLQQTKTALMRRMFPQDGADEPELRLDGFSGKWETVSFDSLLARVEIGTNILGSNRYHGLPLLKMGNIQRGYFDFSSFERIPDNAKLPTDLLVRTGDFLFNTRNTMELVGKGATWMGESGAFAFNGNIARLTLERVDTRFFNYLYNHPRSIRDVSKCATGTTSVAAIYPRSLKAVQFQFPIVEEQRAIGEVFSNLDALIAAEAGYITQLTQAKTALLQRMFV